MSSNYFISALACAELDALCSAQVSHAQSVVSAIVVAGLLLKLFLMIGNQTTLIDKLSVLMTFGVVTIYAASFSVSFLCNTSLYCFVALSHSML